MSEFTDREQIEILLDLTKTMAQLGLSRSAEITELRISNKDMYDALKEIKKIAGAIPGKGTLQASEIWNIINPLLAKA